MKRTVIIWALLIGLVCNAFSQANVELKISYPDEPSPGRSSVVVPFAKRGSRDRCLNLSDEVQYFPNRSEISLEAKHAIFLLRMNNYHKSAISILPMEPFDDSVILSQSVSRNRPKDPTGGVITNKEG